MVRSMKEGKKAPVQAWALDQPKIRARDEIGEVYNIFKDNPFKVFVYAIEGGGVIKAICVPSRAKVYSNTAIKKGELYNEAIKSGAKGHPFLKVLKDDVEGILALVSSLGPTDKKKLLDRCSAASGDRILFAVGHRESVNRTLDHLRLFIAHQLNLIYHVGASSFFLVEYFT